MHIKHKFLANTVFLGILLGLTHTVTIKGTKDEEFTKQCGYGAVCTAAVATSAMFYFYKQHQTTTQAMAYAHALNLEKEKTKQAAEKTKQDADYHQTAVLLAQEKTQQEKNLQSDQQRAQDREDAKIASEQAKQQALIAEQIESLINANPKKPLSRPEATILRERFPDAVPLLCRAIADNTLKEAQEKLYQIERHEDLVKQSTRLFKSLTDGNQRAENNSFTLTSKIGSAYHATTEVQKATDNARSETQKANTAADRNAIIRSDLNTFSERKTAELNQTMAEFTKNLTLEGKKICLQAQREAQGVVTSNLSATTHATIAATTAAEKANTATYHADAASARADTSAHSANDATKKANTATKETNDATKEARAATLNARSATTQADQVRQQLEARMPPPLYALNSLSAPPAYQPPAPPAEDVFMTQKPMY